MKGKAESDSEEIWFLMQCWTDLVPMLDGGAQVHAAIVVMHIGIGMHRQFHQDCFIKGFLDGNVK